MSTGSAILDVLASPRLLRYMSKGYRPVALFSKYGDIDRRQMDRSLSTHRVMAARAKKRLHFWRKSGGSLILLNRNPKSRLIKS